MEVNSVWLEQSCKDSRAESKGRSTGLRVRRFGNREPVKGFGQERDMMKPGLLESSLTNSGEKCWDTLMVSIILPIKAVLQ